MSALPYRPNVGIALFSGDGLVFAGRAVSTPDEPVPPGFEWQMPQGGIDPDEDLIEAARRELFEETAIRSVQVLAITDAWWPYDFPVHDRPPDAPPQRYRGQTQKWVAMRFVGAMSEIDIRGLADQPVEFTAWGWFPLAVMPDLVVPFRRATYEKIVQAFAGFARSSG